jgi:hypothetical protein
MTGFAVERTATAIRVGVRPPRPERTALVEARGALLFWDVLDRRAHPAADIFDARAAADWLWEVYGPDTAAAILGDAASVATEWESPVLDAARDLAHLHWAGAWWPGSHAAAVPALAGGLLRAETAWRTAALDHLLDDEDAVERALAGLDLGDLPVLGTDPALAESVAALQESLTDLAETFGVELRASARIRPEDWALAAGGGAPDLAVASGSDPIEWALVPHGLLDAAGEATWQFAQRSGTWVITVTAPAAPGAEPVPLIGLFDAVEIPLHLDRGAGAFIGEAPAPPDFAMRLRGRVRVYAPRFAVPGDSPDEDREAVIAFARARLSAPDATLTERAAAWTTT